MTTPRRTADPDPDLQALTLRSPDALLAAVPYLLGFEPSESAVLLWLRRGRILLTQRVDLPARPQDYAPWLRVVWSHRAAEEADEIIVVLVAEHPVDPALLDAVLRRADRSRLDVRDVLRVDAGRWWSLMCTDPACCPLAGRALDAGAAATVGAEFTVRGSAPMPDRAAVAASLDPDPARVALVAGHLPSTSGGASAHRLAEPDRDAALDTLHSLAHRAGDRDIAPATAAQLLEGLADIRVRDTFLWDVAQLPQASLHDVWAMLVDLLRSAPAGRVAPVATCAAVVAWLIGDGARVLMALERVQREDPAYSLAGLVAAAVQSGLPPQSWRDAMSGLTRAQCRAGGTVAES